MRRRSAKRYFSFLGAGLAAFFGVLQAILILPMGQGSTPPARRGEKSAYCPLAISAAVLILNPSGGSADCLTSCFRSSSPSALPWIIV